jgi:hypothetical protein
MKLTQSMGDEENMMEMNEINENNDFDYWFNFLKF